MANVQRGEATITGPEGKEFTLCLTLGAMVQIEEGLGIENLSMIDEVFANPSMKKMTILLIALLQGGGHAEVNQDSMMTWPLDMKSMMSGIKNAFANAGFGEDEEETPEEDSRQLPLPFAGEDWIPPGEDPSRVRPDNVFRSDDPASADGFDLKKT